jgi:ComF family protein
MLHDIINLFYPKVCKGCENILLENEKVICTICRHEIPLTNQHKTVENENFNRFYGRINIQSANSLFYYNKKGITQQLIHNLKFNGHQEIGVEIADWFSDHLKNHDVIKTVDEIIPVPLHKKRLNERGYNQVESFAKTLSENLKIPYNPNLLIRNVYTEKQSKKNFLDRNETKISVFDVVFSETSYKKHFLLIDDVVTTGATLELCANALHKIPESKVSIVTMAMSQS